jgi:hypothetical protein
VARGKKTGARVNLKIKAGKRLGRVQEGPDLLIRLGLQEPPPPVKTPEELALERVDWNRRFYISNLGRKPLVTRFKVQKGELLFQRLGYLNAVKQSRGDYGQRAPEPRGIWAFPWPAGDIAFFAGHKWEEVLPKKLQHAAFAVLAKAYEDARAKESRDLEETERIGAEMERFHDEKERWIKDVGPKVMPIRRFYYGGALYSRMNLQGQTLSYAVESKERWMKMTVGQYIAACRKTPLGYSTDHLEVFIPGSVS